MNVRRWRRLWCLLTRRHGRGADLKTSPDEGTYDVFCGVCGQHTLCLVPAEVRYRYPDGRSLQQRVDAWAREAERS